MFLFGIPQQFLETVVGQYFGHSLIDTFRKVSAKFLGVAVTSALVSGALAVYYIYIMAYCLMYVYVLKWL